MSSSNLTKRQQYIKEYEQRLEVIEKRREYYQRPEVKERRRKYQQRPEVIEKRREYYQRPEVKERKRKYQQRPEVKEKKRLYALKNKDLFNKHRNERKTKTRKVSSYKDITREWASDRRNRLKHSWRRRKNLNVSFDLTLEDILELVPKDLKCPVYKKPFVFNGNSEWNLSFDRINNSKGYFKDNVVVVSMRVNAIKNVATVKEMYQVADFYYEIEKNRGLIG